MGSAAVAPHSQGEVVAIVTVGIDAAGQPAAQFATVLGVTIDELFGRRQQRKLVKQGGDSRLR